MSDDGLPQKPAEKASQQGEPIDELMPRQVPIFYDEDSRRWPFVLRGLAAMAFLFGAGALILLVSLVAMPLMPRTQLPKVTVVGTSGNLEPVLTYRERHQLSYKQDRDRKLLDVYASKTREVKHRRELRAT